MTIKILCEISIYILTHDISSCYIYMSSIKIRKTKQKYMKQWRSHLARLNKLFKDYMLSNYKVIDYEIKKPSPRPCITWKPYGYYKCRRSIIARRRCIKYMTGLHKTLEVKATRKKSKPIMHFDTGSYDILVDNCCSQSITNTDQSRDSKMENTG
jgi:hypothetical protein